MNASRSPYLRPRSAGERALVSVGTMNFGKRTPATEAHRMVHRAIERGCTLFDTANAYEGGESEKILGAALKEKRGSDVMIATKVGFGRTGGKLEGLSRAAIERAIDGSLSRLGVDVVDLYYLHVPDYETPIEESLAALFDLISRGKIRHFGVSNFASWQMLEIFRICDDAKQERPAVSQQLYNLLIRQLDIEYFKFTKKHPIHTTTYNALAGGLLARPHVKEDVTKGSRFDKNALYQKRYWSDHFFSFKSALEDVANEAGMSLVDLAYAWLANRSGVDSILVGAGTVLQFDQAVDAVAKNLDDSLMKKIDELSIAFAGTDATYAR
ncbi:MAG: aldo/keto reductase [Polyangiaceae bacterium]